MNVSLRLVLSLLIGAVVLGLLAFMVNSYISGGENFIKAILP